jgi:hypothetical protein
MFKRFSNSWQLFKASLEVLKQDRELLWFPVFSSLAALVVVASFMVPLVFWGSSAPEIQQGGEMPFGFYLGMFAFYIVLYFVIFFFNTALVGAAMMRLDGRDPTVSDGLRIARERVGAIFGYAVIAATVGLLLQVIEGRVGHIGKVVVGLLGASWTVASFLVVPVLVTRDVGPVDAVKESVQLLKKSWGENIIGHLGLGTVFVLVYLALFSILAVIAIPLATLGEVDGSTVQVGTVVLAIVAIPLLLLVVAVQFALTGIYSAALYRYSTNHEAVGGFSSGLLESAFRIKDE